ncbi:MAG: hypothetical protein CVT94_09385 [Bacteroidetes bacterium HGW-Bacteroidetes-11]|jgi:hypothetical protein|nr:MAG: hypothetical protein CVT94_09385 [Bacteroidetes bacterium HGW-Bacteroidetes-11]
MTEQEFVDKVNHHYFRAHDLYEGNGGYNIRRGTAHVISGYLEDLFALYMAQKIGSKENHYLLDKIMSIESIEKKRATSFKPDLAILQNGAVTHYYDLKTNLGWNRYLEEYLKKKDDLIKKIKGKNGWIRFAGEPIQNIVFSEQLKYQMVVFNGFNINPKDLQINIAYAATLENVEMHILNTFNEKDGTLNIDLKAFDCLYEFYENQ